MSNSKPLPPCTYDLLCYLNRDQLERFSIVCRPMKTFIERYFYSKPSRVFDRMEILGGSYALVHNNVQWHPNAIPNAIAPQYYPNRDDYSVQQFLNGQKWNIGYAYYSFVEMQPYLGPTIRIKLTLIYVAGGITYNPEHIEQMESISYLWRDGVIQIDPVRRLYLPDYDGRIVAEDFKPILNSPTILQCRDLCMYNAHFSFKDYKLLYTVKNINIYYRKEEIDPNFWLQFLEQSGKKPGVVFHQLQRKSIDNVLDQLTKIQEAKRQLEDEDLEGIFDASHNSSMESINTAKLGQYLVVVGAHMGNSGNNKRRIAENGTEDPEISDNPSDEENDENDDENDGPLNWDYRGFESSLDFEKSSL